jgi:hypothetical protein
MQHFAHITNGIVDQVIAIDAATLATGFWGDPATWVETCPHTWGSQHSEGGTPLRANFAQVGSTYDAEIDIFISPKPYASWVLNEETYLWEAPTSKPQDTQNPWVWNESLVNWVELT